MSAGVRHNVSFETNNIVLIACSERSLYSLFKMATVWRSQCAFSRFFIGKTGNILNYCADLGSGVAARVVSVIIALDVHPTPRNAPPSTTCDRTMPVHPSAQIPRAQIIIYYILYILFFLYF